MLCPGRFILVESVFIHWKNFWMLWNELFPRLCIIRNNVIVWPKWCLLPPRKIILNDHYHKTFIMDWRPWKTQLHWLCYNFTNGLHEILNLFQVIIAQKLLIGTIKFDLVSSYIYIFRIQMSYFTTYIQIEHMTFVKRIIAS